MEHGETNAYFEKNAADAGSIASSYEDTSSPEYRAFLLDYFSIDPQFAARHQRLSHEEFAERVDHLFLSVRDRQKKAEPEMAKKLGKFIFDIQIMLISDYQKLQK